MQFFFGDLPLVRPMGDTLTGEYYARDCHPQSLPILSPSPVNILGVYGAWRTGTGLPLQLVVVLSCGIHCCK